METEQNRQRIEQEKNYESRETEEGEKDPELQKAAVLERADFLVKEVKTNKQQMKNIMVHMQQVTTAIQQLRTLLQLVAQDDPTSVAQDKDRILKLKKNISLYQEELEKMKGDLIAQQMEELQKTKEYHSGAELARDAEKVVDDFLAELKK